jgi:hypothetical protein
VIHGRTFILRSLIFRIVLLIAFILGRDDGVDQTVKRLSLINDEGQED